jgi:hypothetical protein
MPETKKFIPNVTLDLTRLAGFGWRCSCGGASMSLLRGTNADFTVRCGCGRVFRAQLEEIPAT